MDPRQRPQQRQHHQYRHPAPAPALAPANPNNFTSSAIAFPFPRPQATPSPGSPFSAYPPDQRRTSDTPYYPPAARSGLPTDLVHAHAQSASSLPPARQLGRAMAPPPPTSPTQPGPQPAMVYGPPPPRPPPLAVGPPNAFPSARELPALGALARSGSAGGSSMSISSMLGGPPRASRDSQHPPSQHYPPHATAPGSSSGYAPSVHVSPRMHSASSEYPSFRRPQTPDHQRPYDPRATAAPSPRGHYSTPDLQRYGTPQAGYHSRHPPAPADTAREPGRMSAGPPPAPGGNQPKPYGSVAPRPDEPYARREEAGRHAPGLDYKPERSGPRPYAYDDRYRAERERQGVAEPREREGTERAYSGGDSHRHMLSPREMGRRESHTNQPQYGRPPDSRDPRDAQWGRPSVESNYRAPMDHQRPPAEPPSSSGPYPPHNASPYQAAPPERYQSASHPPPHPQASSAASQQFEPPEHSRMDHMHQQHQQTQHYPLHRPRHAEEAPPPPPPPSIAYNGGHNPSSFDSRSRNSEEPTGPSSHQRNLLAVQDINRKGRVSPLPQAVQGGQPQHPGPAGEPGIKSEFGRMFSGIGSGVGAIGVSDPATAGAVAASIKREYVENAATDSGPEAAGKGRGRRRKLKDDGDDDTLGRVTPAGRNNKRAKAHQHHHHQYAPTPRPLHLLFDQSSRKHSHHHHHHHVPEATSSPTTGVAPFKNLRGGPSAASPAEKGAPAPHHHHHHHGPRPAQQTPGSQAKQPAQSPTPVVPPKPKITITSKAVLDAVAHRPRHHLGDFIYEARLKPGRLLLSTPSHRGYSSNPKPLPLDVIEGKENCILTVKVPRVHLSPLAREEITARAYLWGTDVYTDDSDVMAACIHDGWIKGEWAEDVDNAVLDLDDGHGRKTRNRANESLDLESEGLINSPPLSGPLAIPANRDLHVNVLILPKLAKYAATTRFGISSREFGGQYGARQSIHDGISYMVESIRWVENGGQPQARLCGKARRERMRKVMKEVTASFGNTNGLEQHQPIKVHDVGILRSDMIGRWHRRSAEEGPKECPDADDKEREPSEGDKKSRLAHEGRPVAAPQDVEAAPSENVEMGDVDAAVKSTSGDEK